MLPLSITDMPRRSSPIVTLGVVATTNASGGVAYWAQIGGFVFGLVVTLLFAATRGTPALRTEDTRGSH